MRKRKPRSPSTRSAVFRERAIRFGSSTAIQVVCEWNGNSEAVATKQYLQVTTDHVASALADPTILMHQSLQTGAGTSRQARD